MKLDFKSISNFKPCVIAETACGHDGNLKKLIKLIDIASEAGSQAIKFQIYKLTERSLPNTKEHKIFKKLLLTDKEWKTSVVHAQKKNMFVFADVYGDMSFRLAQSLKVDGYKIHSEDTLNTSLIKNVIKTNKIVLISVGASHRVEIKSLLEELKKNNQIHNVILMPGIQTFPTPLEGHSITEVSDLINKYSSYGVKVGFADHIEGGAESSFILPLMALSAGAVLIEKHFTTDRKLKQTDYHSSLDKKEFKDFMKKINKFSFLHRPISELSKWEFQYRKMFKKSPAINISKKKGESINSHEINYVKNNVSGQSLSSQQLIGKKLNKKLNKDSLISLNDITQKIGIIVVARVTSTRLPNKAICKILDQESIRVLLKRLKRIKNSNEIILATSIDKSDDILEEIAFKEKVNFYRGSLNNVALRFYEAAKKYKLDQIVRVTGDAILCDEIMLEKAIDNQLVKGCDVTFINNMPYGTAKEVFTFRTIEMIAKYAIRPENTEYLEWYLENTRNFKVDFIESEYVFDKSIRLTLDYKEDLELFNKIFFHFKNKIDQFTLKDVLIYLKDNPELVRINSHFKPKFSKKDLNLDLKI